MFPISFPSPRRNMVGYMVFSLRGFLHRLARSQPFTLSGKVERKFLKIAFYATIMNTQSCKTGFNHVF